MNKVRVILVDDEKAGLDNLNYYLSGYKEVNILGMYQHPEEVLQGIADKRPNVVFLDIMMPEMDGVQLAAEIINHVDQIEVVFVTAFDSHAIKAFELNAIDYVLKPFSKRRMDITVDRLNKLLLDRNIEQQKAVHQPIGAKASKKEIVKIPGWKEDRIFLCDPSEIGYLCSEDGYVKICTSDGESYTSKEALNYFDTVLRQKKFFRCHKSFIVNIDKINEVIPWFNNTYLLMLKGFKDKVPVSRNYIKSFKGIFDL